VRGLRSWSSDDRFLSRLMPFAQATGGGSFYALWAHQPGASTSEDALRAYCKERLAPYKVPARVEFRKELPKTMVGKILRRALASPERAASPCQ